MKLRELLKVLTPMSKNSFTIDTIKMDYRDAYTFLERACNVKMPTYYAFDTIHETVQELDDNTIKFKNGYLCIYYKSYENYLNELIVYSVDISSGELKILVGYESNH